MPYNGWAVAVSASRNRMDAKKNHLKPLGKLEVTFNTSISEAPRGPPPADGASLVFLPLVEDPPQAWTGEDQGGGEQLAMLPPALTPPTEGGEFKGCHSSPWQAKGHSGMFR
jgi:hypothetical protein